MINNIKKIIELAEEKKAFDVKAFDLKNISAITDCMIIASGNNEKQAKSIADNILENFSEERKPLNKEGMNTGKWIILDYGDIIIHIFEKNEREYYNLEKLWIDCDELNIEGRSSSENSIN